MNSDKSLEVFYHQSDSEIVQMVSCLDKSCKDNFCHDPAHGGDYFENPVGSHLIQLDLYDQKLEELFKKLRPIFKKCKKIQTYYESKQSPSSLDFKPSDRKKRLAQPIWVISNAQQKLLLKSAPGIPEFPQRYPFQDTLQKSEEPKILIISKSNMQHSEIEDELDHFSEIIVLQAGYQAYESDVLKFVRRAAEKFLEKFMLLMSADKEIGNLVDLVNLVLNKIGFEGICGIHDFYFRNVVKAHDVMYEQCVAKFENYENMKSEIITTYTKHETETM